MGFTESELNLAVFVALLLPAFLAMKMLERLGLFVAGVLFGRLTSLSIGSGRPIFGFSVGKAWVSFHRNPLRGGTVVVFPRSSRLYRTRMIVMATSGIIAQLLAVGVAWSVSDPDWSPVLPASLAVGAALVFHVWLSLRHRLPAIRSFISTTDDEIEVLQRGYETQKSILQFEDEGRYGELMPLASASLAEHPDGVGELSMMGLALMYVGREGEAIVPFSKAIDLECQAEFPNDLSLAAAETGLAHAFLVDGEASRLDIAVVLTRSVQGRANHPWFVATLGSALVQTDAAVEGVRILEGVRGSRLLNQRERANVLAFLAIGYHRLGEAKKARQLSDEARPHVTTAVQQRMAAAERTCPLIPL